MSWENLRGEIEDLFSLYEGVDLPLTDLHGQQRLLGYSVWSPEKKLLAAREYMKTPEYRRFLETRRLKGRSSENAGARIRWAKNKEETNRRRREKCKNSKRASVDAD